jgi:hypothetical protein
MQWFQNYVVSTEVMHVKIMGMLQNWITNWWNSVYIYLRYKINKGQLLAVIMLSSCLKFKQR